MIAYKHKREQQQEAGRGLRRDCGARTVGPWSRKRTWSSLSVNLQPHELFESWQETCLCGLNTESWVYQICVQKTWNLIANFCVKSTHKAACFLHFRGLFCRSIELQRSVCLNLSLLQFQFQLEHCYDLEIVLIGKLVFTLKIHV